MSASDIERELNIVRASTSRYRLIFAVGNVSRVSSALDDVAVHNGVARLPLGRTLMLALVGVAPRLRSVDVDAALEQAFPGGLLVLDHIEALFEPSLEINAVGALKQLARTRSVVAHWPGVVADGQLVYGEPGHPEYVTEALDGVAVVHVGDGF